MRKISMVMGLAAVLATTTTPVDAGARGGEGGRGGAVRGGGQGGPRVERGERRWERFLGRFDTNKDGKIVESEFALGENPALRLDKDSDGTITRSEAMGAAAGDGSAMAADRMFERIDADKDGKITAAEIEKERTAMFARMDANHDGQLSREEWEQGRGRRGELRQGVGGTTATTVTTPDPAPAPAPAK